MYKNNNLRRNGSGYSDPTAYIAIKRSDEEADRFYKLLHTIFYICKLAGFKVEGRISLTDLRTGKTWN